MSAVYNITNTVNGNFYIGSSVRVRIRFYEHRHDLRKGIHHCAHLQRAWNKYGETNFRFEVVEQVEGDLLAAEDRWLAEHHGKPHCYNTGRVPGAAFLGRKHTDEAKAKVSKAQKERPRKRGYKLTPETRARMSAAAKGKKKSPEHAEKIRQRMLGTSYAKGRVVTDEQRAAMGKAVAELTTGLEFITVADAAKHFGIERPNLIRTLRNGGLVKRGPHAGLHFRYLPPAA